MSRPPPPPRNQPPGERFRAQIEAAIAEGAAREDLRLRLTLRDANSLSRDPTIPLADIAYGAGGMKFLGVPVERGGVDASVLERKRDLA